MRAAIGALVVIVMGCAIAGIGMGESPAQREAAPGPLAVAAAKQRIAAGGVSVGRERFGEEGCDRCHSIAAIGAEGKLGPRLDALDEDVDDIVESIVEPRADTVDGYPEKLMPTDYGRRLRDAEVDALAAFIAAAAGTEDEDDGGNSGRGRGRGGRGNDDSGRG